MSASQAQPIPSDIIGVIAGFLTPTTKYHQPLMLVCTTWYQGVVEQDGMRPKPEINWPMDAMKQRQPKKVRLDSADSGIDCGEIMSLNAAVPTLESLHVGSCFHITDESLLHHLLDFRNLLRLNISECCTTDDGLLTIATQARYLQHLDISCCRSLADEGLKHIADNLATLTELNCGSCAKVTDVGVQHLVRLPALTALNVEWCYGVGSDGIEAICSSGLAHQLTSLNISCCYKIPDECLKQLEKLKHLKKLCCPPTMTDETLKAIFHIHTLRELRIHDAAKITNNGMEDISHLEHLTVLHCSACAQLNDLSFEHISRCPSLLELSIDSWKHPITDASVGHIVKLEMLRRLTLVKTTMGDAGLKHLANLSELVYLNLSATRGVTNEGFKHFSGQLQQLQTLDISRSSEVEDPAAGYISTLKSLRRVSMSCTAISDEGLQLLGTLPRLQHLEVLYCKKTTEKEVELLQERIATVWW